MLQLHHQSSPVTIISTLMSRLFIASYYIQHLSVFVHDGVAVALSVVLSLSVTE